MDIDKEWNYHHPRTFLIGFTVWELKTCRPYMS